jgi:hypothetical protein
MHTRRFGYTYIEAKLILVSGGSGFTKLLIQHTLHQAFSKTQSNSANRTTIENYKLLQSCSVQSNESNDVILNLRVFIMDSRKRMQNT